MAKIQQVTGREILDSRGNPTVAVTVTLEGGISAEAMVPSGASTGAHEAVELRDGDKNRYLGKGVQKAVEHVNTVLAEAVVGLDAADQQSIDNAMIALDGTPNKGRLGANAILGVSLAAARAAALEQGVPLYEHINTLLGTKQPVALPVPMFNVLNGGVHSDSGLSCQEFMLVPHGIAEYPEQLRAGAEIFHTLKKLLGDADLSTSVGDEGGFAPRVKDHDEAFSFLLKAIEAAGYVPGKNVSIALDTAASEFFNKETGLYDLSPEGESLKAEELVQHYQAWQEKYHVISIEDGLHEDDWAEWSKMVEVLPKAKQFIIASHPEKIESDFMLVGDDLLVTNPKRLEKAIAEKACTAILIKVNQIGTLSETLDCIRMAQANNIRVVVSHRSGETTDDFIADLAVGTGAEAIKTGSLSRGERLAKYNRLLAIGEEL
ncbi:phosphopyruvate hydratase [Candidatus Kaiserbacteria bacterium]|nr:phosphopyruvate hydratase [Candidatus Kaiserbacteria bacterium]MCB9812240.1 phosphopyruvate hydratase [Candidatus Nomurabacteria bacterium]